ncbi:hypothetical protein HDV00_002448 [Rhizophlyctis rosea]|nr:hypothetical protein HDV00_002448 [Rhizophlyctis rosea]
MKFASALTLISLVGSSLAQSQFFTGKYSDSNATLLDTAAAAAGQANRDPSVKTLLSLASPFSNVTDLLKPNNTILLAPSDSAFNTALQMPGVADAVKDNGTLTTVLQYHIIPNSPLDAKAAPSAIQVYTTSAHLPVKIVSNNGEVTITTSPDNTAKVVEYVSTTTGDILIIDQVLFPPKNATAVLSTLGLSSLAGVAQQLNLTSALDGFKNVTIFAPNNEAFAAIQSTASTLSPQTLSGIITLHVVQGVYYAQDIIAAKNATVPASLQNYAVQATLSSDSKVNVIPVPAADGAKQATVVSADNLFAGGVIHVIDSVLLPQIASNGSIVTPTSLAPAAAATASAKASATPTAGANGSSAAGSIKVNVMGALAGLFAVVALLL